MVGAVVTRFLSDEGWFMRAVFGVAILAAGYHALLLLAWIVLGISGQGWNGAAVSTNVLVIVFVWQWGSARHWRRRALAAEQPLRDLQDVEFAKMEWLDRTEHPRRAWMGPYREGFGG